jgi:MFS transporter, OFA family, oxalate/formate antiporter
MSRQERRGWIIVAALFFTLFLVWGGGVNTAAVFFTPLLKYFGWSRARLSTLSAAGSLIAALAAPAVGWLLDRIEARVIMVAGAALAGAALLAASRADSYAPLLLANLGIAIGVTASTLLPCQLVVANWFTARRGIAMGVTFAGTSLGGAAMTIVANRAIAHGGWRGGYVVMALPVLVLVIPVLFLLVRTRPDAGRDAAGEAASASITGASAGPRLPGFEMRDAVRTRSFWMLSVAQFFYACAVSGVGLHMVAYLIGAGYTAARAAGALSAIFLVTSVGKLVTGGFADRIGPRTVLAVVFAGATAGTIMLLGASRGALLAGFILLNGTAAGTPLVLLPMVAVESLGLRRLGSILGVSGIFGTIGAAIGPVAAGRIFDLSGSYEVAFIVFAAMWTAAAIAIAGCRPLEREEARLRPAAA